MIKKILMLLINIEIMDAEQWHCYYTNGEHDKTDRVRALR